MEKASTHSKTLFVSSVQSPATYELPKEGLTGRNVHYVLSRKQDINRTNGT